MGKFTTDPKKLTSGSKFAITYVNAEAKQITLTLDGDLKAKAKGKNKVTLKDLMMKDAGAFTATADYVDGDGMEMQDLEQYAVF